MNERLQRLVFGEVAERYDKARPDYPAALYDDIATIAGLQRGDPVLEVGAGTGKATRALVERGYAVTAIEPDEAMAAVCKRRAPTAAVHVGELEAWNPTAEFALVASAQAWHWIDPVHGPTRAAASLRPGGWIALWWNGPAPDPDPLHAAVHAAVTPVYERLAPALADKGVPGHTALRPMQRAVDGLEASGRFEPPVTRVHRWSKIYDTAGWCELLITQSDHRLLDADVLEALLSAVAEVIDDHGGSFEHRYETRLAMARVR